MEEMRLAGILCDVTLVAGNVDIQAHKVVLANTSQYFHSMFVGGSKEKESSRIVMEGLEPEILTILIEYCYSSRIMVTQDNVKCLYSASKTLEFWDVNKACSRFLMNEIQPENCFELKTFAKYEEDIDFVSKCDSYIVENFADIVKQEEFLKMNKEDLLVFIASDSIGLENEEQVFDCIISWIDHDKSLRSEFFQDFLEHIRFSNLSSEYLVTKIENEPLINMDGLKDTVSKVLSERLLEKDSSPSLQSVPSKPRRYLLDMMLVVMGGIKCDFEIQGEGFSFTKNTWSPLCEIPDGRIFCGGAVVVRDKVYVMGGVTQNQEYTNTVCMYDPSEDAWTSFIPSMLSERAFQGVAVLNDCIYAIGGMDDMEERFRTAEVLDLTIGGTQEWRNIASMNTGRDSIGVAVLNGKIYAVGGRTEVQHHLSSVESYDPELDVWSPVADLSVPRAGPGVCVLDGVLYCVGGTTKSDSYSNTVEKYDEASNTWSLVAEMNLPRQWPGVIAHAGRLYVVGGQGGDTIHSSVEMYDPQSNTWTLVTDMSTGRMCLTVALINNKPSTYKSGD